jgi:dihydroflavonol-4-reductase
LRIFITGGTGFLGSHLIKQLVQAGYDDIRALYRDKQKISQESKITWIEGDILDAPLLEEVMIGVDWVFHCAAVVSFDPRDFKQMYQANAEGTANVVNMALEAGVKKFIHVSSVAAIGRNEKEPIVTEQTKWIRSPLNTHYAESKYQAEQEVWRGAAEGLNVVVVNPGVILGMQSMERGTGRMFNQVNKGLRFYTRGNNGFVDVNDVAKFMILLAESDIIEKRFILVGENLPYKHVFELIAKALHKKAPDIQVTPLIAAIAWRVEWLKSRFSNKRPLITKETAMTSAHSFFYENAQSLAAFQNFKYTPIEKVINEIGKQL